MVIYQVWDRIDQRVVSTHKNAQAARNKRDRLDLEYGACRYNVRTIKQ